MAMPVTLEDSIETRQAMIDACLWMNAAGLNQGTAGNISVRTKAGVLITPSGVPYDALTPGGIVRIAHEDTPPPGTTPKPSSEWRLHQRLLAARPDMPVVLHAHPPHCTALAIQRRPIPACHYMVAAFGGRDVPLADYALFGGEALAVELARVLRDRHGCLMANHGALVLGEDIARARWRLEELETLARMYLLARIGGTPHILSDDEIAEVAVQFRNYGPSVPQPSSE